MKVLKGCMFDLILTLVLQQSGVWGIRMPKGYQNCTMTIDSRKRALKSDKLFSPNYPHAYPQGIGCQYDFIARGQERIQINVTHMNLYYSSGDPKDPYDCTDEDKLIVIVYIDGKEERLGEYCGQKPPPVLMSNGDRMRVIFKSYNNVRSEQAGYIIEYQFRKDFGVQGNGAQDFRNICTFNFRSTKSMEGTFTSPNYGGQYPRLTECRYLFYGRLNEHVEIEFLNFDVDGIIPRCDKSDTSDYVEFSNFLNAVDRQMPRYCGSQTTYAPQRSDSSFFRVTFKSNEKFDADGFRARYTFKTDLQAPITAEPRADVTLKVTAGSGCIMGTSWLTVLMLLLAVISAHTNLRHDH